MAGFVSGIDELVRLGMTVFGALFWDIPLAMKRMTRAVLAGWFSPTAAVA